jgi:hypothetical protein
MGLYPQIFLESPDVEVDPAVVIFRASVMMASVFSVYVMCDTRGMFK